jgi:hypothetical protein
LLSGNERSLSSRRKYDATHRLVTFDTNVSLSQSDRIKRTDDSKIFEIQEIELIAGHHYEAELEEVTT